MTKQKRQREQRPQSAISIRRGMLTLSAVVLVATTALGTIAVSRLVSYSATEKRLVNNQPPAVEMTTVEAPPRYQGGRDELRIEMSTNGFTPTEVTHGAGAFAIAVENVDIAGEYLLRLKTADGTLLKEINVQKGSASWTVELAAGNYRLTEASHPTWLCEINVQ